MIVLVKICSFLTVLKIKTVNIITKYLTTVVSYCILSKKRNVTLFIDATPSAALGQSASGSERLKMPMPRDGP